MFIKFRLILQKKDKSVKLKFSKKATRIDEIFTVDLTLCSKCQIYGEDFVNTRGLLRKYKLLVKTHFFPRHFPAGWQKYLGYD